MLPSFSCVDRQGKGVCTVRYALSSEREDNSRRLLLSHWYPTYKYKRAQTPTTNEQVLNFLFSSPNPAAVSLFFRFHLSPLSNSPATQPSRKVCAAYLCLHTSIISRRYVNANQNHVSLEAHLRVARCCLPCQIPSNKVCRNKKLECVHHHGNR